MVYTPNTKEQQEEMLQSLGLKSIEDFYTELPAHARNPQINLPEPLSEPEIAAEMQAMADLNASVGKYACFLGAGAYNHYVPAAVPAVTGRSEFYTAYTPYQPELSQGTLQTIYEYQSLAAHLAGMDVANASMYDAATGTAEACMMANRATRRNHSLYMNTLNPEIKKVMETYAIGADLVLEEISEIPAEISTDISAVVVQQPDFYGCINDLDGLAEKVQAAGALFVVVFDPVSLGMLKTPGELGADIAVGEGQSLGNPLNFGGPYLGIFCAKTKYMRTMPGRLVGATTDSKGKRAFVLTLATREQHIRREKATSNICSNEALVALGANVYMALMGKNGMKRVAEICYNRAHYLADQISQIPGFSLAFDKPFFKEFTVKCPKSPSEINKALFEKKIIGGLDVSDTVPNGWLLCVTEMNSRKQIDQLVEVLKGL